jgi:hypothetical protein
MCTSPACGYHWLLTTLDSLLKFFRIATISS